MKTKRSPSKIFIKLLHSVSYFDTLWCIHGGDSIFMNFKYNGSEFIFISPERRPMKYSRYLQNNKMRIFIVMSAAGISFHFIPSIGRLSNRTNIVFKKLLHGVFIQVLNVPRVIVRFYWVRREIWAANFLVLQIGCHTCSDTLKTLPKINNLSMFDDQHCVAVKC